LAPRRRVHRLVRFAIDSAVEGAGPAASAEDYS
jgi:hypothetical protein